MKIVIVDDDILVSSALKTILEAGGEVEVTGTGQDGKYADRLYDELQPDVLLMDIRMKDMNGLDAAEQILKRHTDAKILLLTTFSDDAYIVKALKYGVKGYLIKQDYGSILPALQAVQMNQTVFGTEIMSRIPGLLQKEKKEKEQKNTAEAETSRRSRKKQNTHKAILHQAKVLFEKEGIGNVTIEQISESADVSRSTFFSHFASVDDLLKEISDEEINDVFEAA